MRSARLSLLVGIGFMLLLANLVRMQIVQASAYQRLSEKNRVRVIYLEPPRGRILDRNGVVLAADRLSFNCSAIPREAKDRIRESCRILGPILGEDPAALERHFQKGRSGAFSAVRVAEDIPLEEAAAIEERLELLPGFMIETRPQREYPYGRQAAHLLGYIGPISRAEIETLDDESGYRVSDWLGRDGIEKEYETALRGRSGGLQMEVDSRGRFVRALGVKEPAEGRDIQLTVDARLQSHVQELLRGRKGCVLVMDLKDGGFLSLNSSPAFDPNLFASPAGRKKVGTYLRDPDAPLVNRGIHGQYPPGSIFKIVTALAALGERKVGPGTSFHCDGDVTVGGKVFHCWNETGHGPQALTEALSHSCNAYFYQIGLSAGADALVREAARFGFYQIVGVDLPGERAGFVPSREWKRKARGELWYDGETANLAIGQGYLQVTPLQALMMVSAVAKNGHTPRPHLLQKLDGALWVSPPAHSLPEPSASLQAVRKGLEEAVNSDHGTGRLARLPDVRVAGKTGTAQSGKQKTHAWFVGFAPADDPKVAVTVFLEHGGRGGVAAAPVAQSVFRWLKDMGYGV